MSLAEDNVKSFGIRLGRIRGIDVWVHWLLILFLGIQVLALILRGGDIGGHVLRWCTFVVALVVSLLVHEFGHVWAAIRLGGSAERVVLWPLGGLAYVDVPPRPREEFWTAAAGPLAGAILGLLAALVCLAADWSFLPGSEDTFDLVRSTTQQLVLWNLLLGFVNILPCYPLDGGRMFRALAWQRLGNLPQAMAWTLRVSQVVSILAVVTALGILFSSFYDENYGLRHPFLDQLQWTLLLLVILQFFVARVAREDRGEKEMDAGPFGYDFSYGYTSLDRTTTREAKRSSRLSGIARRFTEKMRARRRGRDEEMRRKVDCLLEKIHSGGMASLSWRERRYLKKASRRMRRS